MQSEQQDSILQGGQRNASRNDSHLPECRCAKHHHAPEPWCDCDRLRSCEQRSYSLGIEVGKHDGWVAGHAAGVQAARDAIDAMPGEGGCTAMEAWHDGPIRLRRHIDQGRALAAIDALRGES